MNEKRMATKEEFDWIVEEAVRLSKIELLKKVIKIHHDAISRGSFRVVIHNLIVELEGQGEKA